MKKIDEVAQPEQVIAAGTIPLHPGVDDYRDAKGKVVLFVEDNDQGRSLYMGIEAYGTTPYTYEVRYDDFADIVTRLMVDVATANAGDMFAELLTGGAESDTD